MQNPIEKNETDDQNVFGIQQQTVPQVEGRDLDIPISGYREISDEEIKGFGKDPIPWHKIISSE